MRSQLLYRTTDYHTAGEPFRIVVEGVEPPPGRTVADRRHAAVIGTDGGAAERARRVLCSEPRGHADMYGGFLVPPSPGAAAAGCRLGVLFWHKDGFSTACGHGTIALATWAVDAGVVEAPDDGTVEFGVEVPSGPVRVAVRREEGRCVDVAFTNVPAWVSVPSGRLTVPTSAGPVDIAVSFGGAFYASVRAADLGAAVRPADLTRLIALSREIKGWMEADPAGRAAVAHPDDDRLSGLYGTIWFEDVVRHPDPPLVHQRNVTVFADGEVDRSPCGSGTSARLAVLRHDIRWFGTDATLRHESVVGSRFEAWVERTLPGTPGRPEGVVTTVRGSAYRTGEHAFVLDPHDEIGEGFQLR